MKQKFLAVYPLHHNVERCDQLLEIAVDARELAFEQFGGRPGVRQLFDRVERKPEIQFGNLVVEDKNPLVGNRAK